VGVVSGWRSLELESLLGARPDGSGLTESVLQRLVSSAVEEGEQLDFKSTTYLAPKGSNQGWSEEQEFCKDVASFANRRGGLILIGVEQVAGVATGLSPMTDGTPEGEEQRLRRALVNWAAPLAVTSFVSIGASSGGFYLAVVVPPSRRGPHCVIDRGDSKNPLRYPVRHGSDTRWLSEVEVAERYHRRFMAAAEGRERVEKVVNDACRVLDRTVGAWLYVAVIPDWAEEQSIDTAFIEQATQWHRSRHLNGPIRGHLPALGRGIAGPGKVTFTDPLKDIGDDETRPRGAYVELHGDGCAVAAAGLALRSGQEGGSHRIPELRLVEDTILEVDETATWAVRQVGAWGVATVVIGIYTRDGRLDAKEPFELIGGSEGLHISGTRRLLQIPRAEITADLAAVDTMQQRLVVAHQALSALLQWFGIPEPAQIAADGSLRPQQWGMSYYRQVEAWATDHDVAIRGLQEG